MRSLKAAPNKNATDYQAAVIEIDGSGTADRSENFADFRPSMPLSCQ
jgi:hypothetical protein